MESESLLSPKLIALREAMGPVARSLRSRRQTAPPQTGYVRDMVELVSEHFDRLDHWTGDFADEIDDQLGPVSRDPDATDAQVYRAVARLEARLERLLDDWDDVRSVRPDRTAERGWNLLVDIYRDLAEQVQGWLDELLEILEDPVAALERRGLADEEHVEIPLTLTLEAPAAAKALRRWAEDRLRARAKPGAKEGRGFFWIGVLAVLGLIWLFSGGDE